MPTLSMPQLGESVTEGTVIRWLKRVDDAVALDEPLVEVETDKVNVEIPSPYAGTLTAILVPEGTTVAVGAPLVEIVTAAERASAATEAPAATTPPPAAPPREAPAPVSALGPPPSAAAAGTYQRRRYSPAVERLAAEHDLDLERVSGTGAQGRMTRKDVLAAVERGAAATSQAPAVAPVAATPPAAAPQAAPPVASTPAPPPGPPAGLGDSRVLFSPMRRRIAEHMLRSKQTAPHAWLRMEADVTELVRLRAALKEEFRRREGADLTYLAFVAKAVCLALQDFPLLNATWSGADLIQRRDINLGFAVDVPDGLIVPVIKQADRRSVAALAVAIADVAERARRRRLQLDEVQGGTFTIDNTGVFGVTASAPIINQPQVAIITTEAIVKRPEVVDNDAIAIRSMMNLCLSFDHRAMDGAVAARFVARVKALLQEMGPSTAIY